MGKSKVTRWIGLCLIGCCIAGCIMDDTDGADERGANAEQGGRPPLELTVCFEGKPCNVPK